MLNIDDWLGLFDDAQDAFVGFVERLRMATLPRVDGALTDVQRLVRTVDTTFLPQLGLTADDARKALAQAAGLIEELRGGQWIDAHVETQQGKYHIRLRLEPKETDQ
jgi:hypothetical protein